VRPVPTDGECGGILGAGRGGLGAVAAALMLGGVASGGVVAAA
jgi:hypothetical protein